MKFLPAEVAYLTSERRYAATSARCSDYLAFLTALVGVYTAVFHWIMWEVEGVRHSWVTGLYWTLR